MDILAKLRVQKGHNLINHQMATFVPDLLFVMVTV